MIYNKDIEQYLQEIEIIDTHEHLPFSNAHRNQNTDVFVEYITGGYFPCDLVNSGMPAGWVPKLLDTSIPLMERWNMVEPYWEKCRFTGNGQHLDEAVRVVYGIPEINRDTVEEVSKSIQAGLKRDHFDEVLKQKCHIKTSLLDFIGLNTTFAGDRRFFSPVVQVERFARFYDYGEFMELERYYGEPIRRFDQLKDACERYIWEAVEKGAVAFKLGLAYQRSLLFERADYGEAEKGFNELFAEEHTLPIHEARKPCKRSLAMENYMIHFALSIIEKTKLPLQIHTGLLIGYGNYLPNSNPELLNNLFLEYPKLKFDIFHIGYPYEHTLGGLAKMFPNVYINMCWAHFLSPQASIKALEEWLELVPYNKVLGFGGDNTTADTVAGHRSIALRNITKALSSKVDEGLFTEAQARRVGKALLYDNASALYKID